MPILPATRRARGAAGAALVALAVVLAGCASDGSGGRFRLAGSLVDDLIPGTGPPIDQCNDYHRSLRGRTPAEQQAQLARIHGVQVDAERAARHVEALDHLCAAMPSGA
jgi:hypothetical protein